MNARATPPIGYANSRAQINMFDHIASRQWWYINGSWMRTRYMWSAMCAFEFSAYADWQFANFLRASANRWRHSVGALFVWSAKSSTITHQYSICIQSRRWFWQIMWLIEHALWINILFSSLIPVQILRMLHMRNVCGYANPHFAMKICFFFQTAPNINAAILLQCHSLVCKLNIVVKDYIVITYTMPHSGPRLCVCTK